MQMRNIITLVAGTAVLLVLSGCGSLNQKVGGPELSKPAMEYANQLSTDSSSMSISYGGKELSTSKWGSKLYPIFLWEFLFQKIYWKVNFLGIAKAPLPVRTETEPAGCSKPMAAHCFLMK